MAYLKKVYHRQKIRAKFARQCNMAHKIFGTCMHMCPPKEMKIREREGLVHKLEVSPYEVGIPPGERVADQDRMIKAFSRSAAGQVLTDPKGLRPLQVLLRTTDYLVQNIVFSQANPYPFIYDFVSDRFRSVRQDLVIQRIDDPGAIRIYECIIRFHVISHFWLEERSMDVYDPALNDKNLTECLHILLDLYEKNPGLEHTCQDEFLGLYALTRLNSYKVISDLLRAGHPRKMRCLHLAFKFIELYYANNYVQMFRIANSFPLIMKLYFSRLVKTIRSKSYLAMSVAYGVRSCKVPLPVVCRWLSYESTKELSHDLNNLGIKLLQCGNNPTMIVFEKNSISRLENHFMPASLLEGVYFMSRQIGL